MLSIYSTIFHAKQRESHIAGLQAGCNLLERWQPAESHHGLDLLGGKAWN